MVMETPDCADGVCSRGSGPAANTLSSTSRVPRSPSMCQNAMPWMSVKLYNSAHTHRHNTVVQRAQLHADRIMLQKPERARRKLHSTRAHLQLRTVMAQSAGLSSTWNAGNLSET